MCVAIVPVKANTPFFVDADVELPLTMSEQSSQNVCGRDAQIVQVFDAVEYA